MSATTTATLRSDQQQFLQALGLAAVVVITEYLARHFVLFWFPAIGALRVNDMLAAGVFYMGLVWLTIPAHQRTFADIGRAMRDIIAPLKHWQVWLAAVIMLVVDVALSIADRLLWGNVHLPSVISPWRWDATLLASAAPLLVAASLLVFNGVVIPFAEEWLWRGLIQPRMIGALGFAPGILLTAILFSLKHAIIDASLGRVLAIFGAGIVVGVLAARRSWRTSAAAHALANITATVIALLASGTSIG